MKQPTNVKTYLSALACGLLMGLGLVISGMVNPQKVIGFLDLFGHWDPSLAFVMAGALAVYAPVYWLVVKRREKSALQQTMQIPVRTDLDCKLLIGAILFGIGWGLAGICPGPALTLLTTGESQIVLFVVAMFAGFWLAPKWLSLLDKN
ncbi:YeeE/YedE family protein [Neiella marina]|uniref:YeeE/YedE family protein n=1 Tax=Neiella holothuriorum TaxID=2870530 RepID=A0ABS7ECI3_9GAMM|nr:YeeE/YedE family protein [Neiella holothuriorum]MBW8190006.1 YeeE/YedE family protein [Neiella holothuriorum]